MIIQRPTYINRVKPFIDKNIIKVFTGQRRVGKSCLLKQLSDIFRENNIDSNIIYISKEYDEFSFLRDNNDLSAYVNEKLKDGVPNYLLIDEIQDIKGFEHTLRSLQAQEKCDIYITGSNANMLSSDLATNLSGRYIEMMVSSLSYDEFLTFHKLRDDNEALRKYMTFGGMPYLCNLPLEQDIALEYLKSVSSTILLKDVVAREGIRNVDFLESLVSYVANNVGSLFSANNISRYLKSQNVSMTPLQVINYLKALQAAYIIHKVDRIDIEGLKIFEIGSKYYFDDLGLRNVATQLVIGNDISKVMENCVFRHLINCGYKVFVGYLPKGEVDFVGLKGNDKIYVQVAYVIADEQTRMREFGNLERISDNYPKYVVSLDEWSSNSNSNGIMHLHLRDFLKKTL